MFEKAEVKGHLIIASVLFLVFHVFLVTPVMADTVWDNTTSVISGATGVFGNLYINSDSWVATAIQFCVLILMVFVIGLVYRAMHKIF